MGLRLDDGQLSWRDLHAFVHASPPTSSVFNAVEKGWSTTDYLTALMIDLLAVLAWQNTADGHSRFPRHKPKPIPRPDHGDTTTPEIAPLMGGLGGMPASVMSVEEFQARIEERRRRRAAHGN